MSYLFDINFVDYHRSVLRRTVDLSKYLCYFDEPFFDIRSAKGADLALALELFGPYFTYDSINMLPNSRYDLCRWLFDKLVTCGYNGSIDDLSEVMYAIRNDVSLFITYDVYVVTEKMIFEFYGQPESDWFCDLDGVNSNITGNCYDVVVSIAVCSISDIGSQQGGYDLERYIVSGSPSLEIRMNIAKLTLHVGGCLYYRKIYENVLFDFLINKGNTKYPNNADDSFGLRNYLGLTYNDIFYMDNSQR